MSYYDSKLIKRTKDLKGCCWLFIVMLAAIALGALLSSCRCIRYVPIEKIKTEYVYVNQKDSTKEEQSHKETEKEKHVTNTHTEERDSSATTLDQQGNIIKQENWHWRNTTNTEYIEREKVLQDSLKILHNRLDSLASEKVDSIPVPYPVEKKLSKWEQIKIDLGGWMVGFIILSIIVFCVYLARGKVFRGK